MTTGRLADPCGMEIGTLKHHVLRGFIGTTTLSAKHTGNTHRVLSIADSQVTIREFMLLTVKCLEGRTLRHRLHYNLMTFHHICIECMQWLTIGHHDIVSNVNDIIDRTQTNSGQLVFQPFGRLFHFTIGYAHTGIALAGLLILNCHLNRQIVIVNIELRAIRTMHSRFVTIALQPGIKITGHSPVTQAVSTIGSNIHLNEPVAFQMIVFSSRGANDCIFRQHDDTVVRSTHTYLVLCTDHTVRFHATQFRLLDHELLIAIIEHAAEVSHNHFLTSCHVRRTTHNLRGFTLA